MKARILGLGQWLPEVVRNNRDWPEDFATLSLAPSESEPLSDNLGGATADDLIALRYFQAEAADPFLGTRDRRIADAGTTAAQAEAHAARSALSDAGVRAVDIDALFSWAAVPDRVSPSNAPKVANLIGADNCLAYAVEADCASVCVQLQLAASLIESGRAKYVLLTQSHLVTQTFRMLHPASPSIGDAATALVVGPGGPGGIDVSFGQTHGAYYDSVTWCRGSADPAWWRSGPGSHMGTRNPSQASELEHSCVRLAADAIRELLRLARLPVSDIDTLCSVQPRAWLSAAVLEALGSGAAAPDTFREFAHIGGCGVVANMVRARELGLLREGQRIVLYAQGAGFTRCAVLVKW